MRLKLVAALTSAGIATAAAQSIEIKIVSATDDQSSFGDKKVQCDLGFEITNDSWGTLHRIQVPLGAIDDRGRGVDKLLSASASNSELFTWVPIAKGQTIKATGRATFEEECRYIATVKIDGPVDDEDCAIRMMPEGASCSDIVKLTTSLPNLKTE
jgi:hypothetical protein